jgi:hypothetical protein
MANCSTSVYAYKRNCDSGYIAGIESVSVVLYDHFATGITISSDSLNQVTGITIVSGSSTPFLRQEQRRQNASYVITNNFGDNNGAISYVHEVQMRFFAQDYILRQHVINLLENRLVGLIKTSNGEYILAGQQYGLEASGSEWTWGAAANDSVSITVTLTEESAASSFQYVDATVAAAVIDSDSVLSA